MESPANSFRVPLPVWANDVSESDLAFIVPVILGVIVKINRFFCLIPVLAVQ